MAGQIVSIIIPAYNAEHSIDMTLRRLDAQSYHPFEVIVVDDGSSDSTASVAERHRCERYSLKVVRQSNKGAASARNAGMAVADGDYLVFLDADDDIEPDFIETLLKLAVKTGADVSCCGASSLDMRTGAKGMFIGERFPLPNGTVSIDEECSRLITFGTVPWNKMFRADFIKSNELKYQSLKVNNDVFFVSSALLLARSIAYDSKPLITYKMFSGKSVQDERRLHPECALNAVSAVKKKCVDPLTSPDVMRVREVNSLSINSFFYSFYSVSDDEKKCRDFFKLFENSKEAYFTTVDGSVPFDDWKASLKYKAFMNSGFKRFRWACGIRADHRSAKVGKTTLLLRLAICALFSDSEC